MGRPFNGNSTASVGGKPIGPNNPLDVALPTSAFGGVRVANLTPQIQRKWVMGLNTQLDRLIQHDGGTVTESAGEIVVGTSTTTSSIAGYESISIVKYEPGEGVDAPFSGRFTTGVAGTTQIAGVGDFEDALAFGYNGADFGVLRRSGGQTEVRTLTVTAGESTGAGTVTVTLNGDAVETEIAENDTIGDVCRKIAATSFEDAGGGWHAFDAGNRVVFTAYGTQTRGGTYSFVDTDTTGVAASIAQSAAASAATDTWVAQTAWSHDRGDGSTTLPTMDFTKGNNFKIQYQHGYGVMNFFIENPNTGDFVLVHQIEHGNANTAPALAQPDMPLMIITDNGATSSDMVVCVTAMSAFTDGIVNVTGVRHVFENGKSLTTTATNLFALRVHNIHNSVTNRVRIFIDTVDVANNGTKTADFTMWKNPGLVGAPSWTNISSDSTVEQDTTATGISGGTELFDFLVGGGAAKDKELGPIRHIELEAGDMIVVQAAQTTGGSAGVLEASLSWVEEF